MEYFNRGVNKIIYFRFIDRQIDISSYYNYMNELIDKQKVCFEERLGNIKTEFKGFL